MSNRCVVSSVVELDFLYSFLYLDCNLQQDVVAYRIKNHDITGEQIVNVKRSDIDCLLGRALVPHFLLATAENSDAQLDKQRGGERGTLVRHTDVSLKRCSLSLGYKQTLRIEN